MFGKVLPASAFCIAVILGFPAVGQDFFVKSVELGAMEYREACAACHGKEGRGDGELFHVLKIPPPNLTELSADNNGAFPWFDVMRTVDGRGNIRSHGGEMPIWGNRFIADAMEGTGTSESQLVAGGRLPSEGCAPSIRDFCRSQLLVRGRIMSLMYFLESIQE